LGLIFLQKIKPKNQSLSEGIFKLREQVPLSQGLKQRLSYRIVIVNQSSRIWIKIRVIQRFANQKVIKKAYICKKKFKV
jgi:hypothetical protein